MVRGALCSLCLLVVACGRLGFDDVGIAGDVDGGPPDAAPSDPLVMLDDGFEGNILRADWQIIHPEYGDVSVVDGVLVVEPDTLGQWFDNGVGVGVVLPVSGDFVATAQVTLTDGAMPPGPPLGPGLEVASLLVRDPASVDGARNNSWVGVGAEFGGPRKESKSTRDSVSVYTLEDFVETRARLRLCRVGSTVTTYHAAYDSGPWEAHQVYTRPDLPTLVHVGLTATEREDPVDIAARFDWISFRTPSVAAGCESP